METSYVLIKNSINYGKNIIIVKKELKMSLE